MPTFITGKKILIFIIILSVLAIALVALALVFNKKRSEIYLLNKGSNSENGRIVSAPNLSKTEVPVDRLPNNFPSNLPLESNVKITQNFLAKGVDGRLQSTRVYESARTVNDNFVVFGQYLKQNNWNVQATNKTDTLSSLIAQKDFLKINVTIAKNSVSKINTVDITISELKK